MLPALLGLLFWAAAPVWAQPPAPERAVIVGGDRSYPPYEFLDAEGNPAGFNVELTRAVARVMGFSVEIRLGSWGAMRQALAGGSVDALEGMAFSRERTAEVDFSVPVAVIHQTIWNRRDGPQLTSVEQLAGRQVIVMRGSIMHDFMRRQQPAAHLLLVDSLADALRQLAAGRGDCALVAKLPGQYLVNKYGLTNLLPVARPLMAQDYGYAVHKGNRALLARFDDGLAILRQTGEYEKLYRKWLGVLEPRPLSWQRLAGYVALAVAPLLLVLGAIVLWSRTLKREVALRTAELEREAARHRGTMDELKIRQRQLLQADKMTSLGILVSGVAHEINNPTGLILLNLPHLEKAFADAEPILAAHYRQQGDFRLGWLNFSRMRREIPQMCAEMQEAGRRIKGIVEDLKDFARQQDDDLLRAGRFQPGGGRGAAPGRQPAAPGDPALFCRAGPRSPPGQRACPAHRAGDRQPAAQRLPGPARPGAGDRPSHRRRGKERRRGADPARRGVRHRRRAPRPFDRSLLHHPARTGRHRPGTVDLRRHRPRARRRAAVRLRSRGRDHRHPAPAGA